MKKTIYAVITVILVGCVLLNGCTPPSGTATDTTSAVTASASDSDSTAAASDTTDSTASTAPGDTPHSSPAVMAGLVQYDGLTDKTVNKGKLLDYPLYNETDTGFDNLFGNLKALGGDKLLFTANYRLNLYDTATNKAEDIGAYSVDNSFVVPQNALYMNDRYYVYKGYNGQVFVVDTQEKPQRQCSVQRRLLPARKRSRSMARTRLYTRIMKARTYRAVRQRTVFCA